MIKIDHQSKSHTTVTVQDCGNIQSNQYILSIASLDEMEIVLISITDIEQASKLVRASAQILEHFATKLIERGKE